jgi:hypothetical protein
MSTARRRSRGNLGQKRAQSKGAGDLYRVNPIVGSFKPARSSRERSGSRARSCLLRFSKHSGEKRRPRDGNRRRRKWRNPTTSARPTRRAHARTRRCRVDRAAWAHVSPGLEPTAPGLSAEPDSSGADRMIVSAGVRRHGRSLLLAETRAGARLAESAECLCRARRQPRPLQPSRWISCPHPPTARGCDLFETPDYLAWF